MPTENGIGEVTDSPISEEDICILVTGVNGFVAQTTTALLLKQGYTVHATLRGAPEGRLSENLLQHVGDRLKLFHADLSTPHAFDAAARECTFAMHLAHPTAGDSAGSDAVTDVIAPSEAGMRHVLSACTKAGVRRLIVMSSVTALTERGRKTTVTEADWNTRSSSTYLPMHYAKANAERVVWEHVKRAAHGALPQVVTLHPPSVWGVGEARAPVCKSKEILVRVANGEMPGIIDLSIPIVHVRDVANALLLLTQRPDTTGRYICCPPDPLVHVRHMVSALHDKGLSMPTTDFTSGFMTTMIKASSHVRPGGIAGQYVRNHLGMPVIPCSNKIVRDLGITFTPALDVLRETVDEIVDGGFVSKSLSDEKIWKESDLKEVAA